MLGNIYFFMFQKFLNTNRENNFLIKVYTPMCILLTTYDRHPKRHIISNISIMVIYYI